MRWILLAMVLSNLACATAVTHTPQPLPQNRLGMADRAGKFSDVGDPGPLAQRALNHFEWPLHSMRVTSFFGARGQNYHQGVDLRAMPGTPVYAAQDGRVLYANHRIRGYGKLIVLRHEAGLSSIYAHNSQILVKTGQRVRKGQIIARTGNTGHSRGPHLHFEVRSGLGAIDPIRYIPGSYTIAFNSRIR